MLDGSEQCDDGNNVTEPCVYGQMSCIVCSPICTILPGRTSYCGDGRVDTINGEQCDGTAMCRPTCQIGDPIPLTCGNGTIEGGEQCDDGNRATERCAYGLMSCTVCGATCTTVPGTTSYCGDGVVNGSNGEECDGQPGCPANCVFPGEPDCNSCRVLLCTSFTDEAINVYGGCFTAIDGTFGANTADPNFSRTASTRSSARSTTTARTTRPLARPPVIAARATRPIAP